MSSLKRSWLHRPLRAASRFAIVCALAGLVAGCFQPVYGDRSLGGNAGVGTALGGVDVAQIAAPHGTSLARLAVETRNALLFELTGGGPTPSPTHKLVINLNARNLSVIVDVNTNRPDIENYGIDATYTLTDLASDKIVLTARTFSRVSYDIPGQQQRFARTRALRDAENRAAKVIAEQIRSRLAAYFVAGA